MEVFPRLGAIAVLVRKGHVLLAQRTKMPDAGLWGFPGGHVEPGETAMEAAVLCEYRGGTVQAADDVSAAAWIPCPRVHAGDLPMSARVGAVLDLAQARLQARRLARAAASASPEADTR